MSALLLALDDLRVGAQIHARRGGLDDVHHPEGSGARAIFIASLDVVVMVLVHLVGERCTSLLRLELLPGTRLVNLDSASALKQGIGVTHSTLPIRHFSPPIDIGSLLEQM